MNKVNGNGEVVNGVVEMKLRDLLKGGYWGDVDVGDDYAESFTDDAGREREACVAFCGGSVLTDEGMGRWGFMMDFGVELSITPWDCPFATVHIPGGTNDEMERAHRELFVMLYTFAGFASCSFYDRMVREAE